MPKKDTTNTPAGETTPPEEIGMKQEVYDALAEQIAAGKLVTYHGRTASTLVDLDFMWYCESQPAAPAHPAPEPFTGVFPARPGFEFPEGGVPTETPIPAQLDGQPVVGIVPESTSLSTTQSAISGEISQGETTQG